MIVADTSALVAILRGEPEAAVFLNRIAVEDTCLVSTAAFLETSMVVAGRDGGERSWDKLDRLMEGSGIVVAAQTEAQARLARDAFLRFGKGRHPAELNFGDCASYALAKERGVALLFKGDDFTRTDIVAAIPAG